MVLRRVPSCTLREKLAKSGGLGGGVSAKPLARPRLEASKSRTSLLLKYRLNLRLEQHRLSLPARGKQPIARYQAQAASPFFRTSYARFSSLENGSLTQRKKCRTAASPPRINGSTRMRAPNCVLGENRLRWVRNDVRSPFCRWGSFRPRFESASTKDGE
jgi:hypothetical protein